MRVHIRCVAFGGVKMRVFVVAMRTLLVLWLCWCPRGLMDKASPSEGGDCGFESHRRRSFCLLPFWLGGEPPQCSEQKTVPPSHPAKKWSTLFSVERQERGEFNSCPGIDSDEDGSSSTRAQVKAGRAFLR